MGHADGAEGLPLADHRHPDSTAGAAGTVAVANRGRHARILLDIRADEHGAVGDTPEVIRLVQWPREPPAVRLDGFWTEIVVGDEVRGAALEPVDDRRFGAAQAARAGDDSLGPRPRVCRRAADHLQDLARRRQVAITS